MAQRGFNPGINIPNPGETHPSVITSLQQIIFKLGRLSNPQFKGMSLVDLAESGAGFMKNDADGLITGGNTIAVSDLPSHATTHESGGVDEVNHDNLLGFDANEHVDHTAVSVTGGGILSGGGDISASRVISLAHSDVDHDQTTNFVSDEHVAHTGVSVTGGGILSGGGDISASRVISLAHSDVDHDQTTNFVANEHIDHTSVTLTAGTGLTGGGDISASRSFAVDGVLEDLDTLGASSADGEFIVATGAGTLAWESGDTARHSLGLGTVDSPTFVSTTLSSGTDYSTAHAVGGSNYNSYKTSATYSSAYLSFYRSRGGLGTETAIGDGDWAGKFRFYGYNGSSYDQYGGFLYDMYDATNKYGRFVFYTYNGSANYIFEAGPEYIRIGDTDGTDYVNIDPSNGHMTFEGDATVWNDIQFEVSSGKVGAANIPTWATLTTNTSEYGFDVDDYIDLNSEEVSHGWKEGTAGNIHMHFSIPDANSSGSSRYAQFTVYIAYVNSSGIWTETSLTAEKEIPDGSSALENFYLDLGDLTLTGLTIGTQIKCRIKRIAATGGTEYGSDVFIHQVGCHLEEDRVGSNTESAS